MRYLFVLILVVGVSTSLVAAMKAGAEDASPTPRVTGDLRLVFEPLPESRTLYVYSADDQEVDPETGGLRWSQPAVTISADGRRLIVAAAYSPTGETLVVKFSKPVVLRP